MTIIILIWNQKHTPLQLFIFCHHASILTVIVRILANGALQDILSVSLVDIVASRLCEASLSITSMQMVCLVNTFLNRTKECYCSRPRVSLKVICVLLHLYMLLAMYVVVRMVFPVCIIVHVHCYLYVVLYL